MSITVWLLLVAVIVIIDQLTKFVAVEYLMPISSFPIVKDVLHLTYVENKGAAFGILQDRRWVFMIVSTIVMLIITVAVFKYKKYFHPLMLTGLAFTVGGGVGNMIDRTVLGYVVDFIDFTLIDFAVFNIADSFICIGVGLIVLDIILSKSDLSFMDGKKKTEVGTDDTEADG